MQRYALRDDQWTKIKDFLPGREGHVGGTAADNRLFVDAVMYRYRTGIPWRDLPERYGDWKATHKRFRRWCESGVFACILGALALDADAEYMSIDSTMRPGGCSCRNITSCSGPLRARQARMRRSRVRRTPLPRPGWRRQTSSNTATARMPGAASGIGTISAFQTSTSGSGRRRPRGRFLCDGNLGSASMR